MNAMTAANGTGRLFRRLVASGVIAALASGCVTAREREAQVKPEVVYAYLDDKPAELRRHFYVTLVQGQRNRVLNDMRLGLAALEMNRAPLAEELFDDALQGIEAIYADNETAKKARDLFVKELTKDFKGEPYERVMAYYYRGLLYLKAGDYDNARASFKGGLLQDAIADEDQSRADFGMMAFLQGWAARCSGNDSLAKDDFKDFRGINKAFPLPADKDNVLVLVETGSPPVKYSATDGGSGKPQILKMRRASATETVQISVQGLAAPAAIATVAIPAAGPPHKGTRKAEAPPPAPILPATASGTVVRAMDLPLLEDIYFQSATRGGREFDGILNGKVQFKSVSNATGKVALAGALIAGSVAANSRDRETQRDAALAAGALLLVGLAAKSLAAATEAEADTRYWDNLPDRVHGMTLALSDKVDKVSVDFFAADGRPLRTKDATITRAGRCGIAWVRGELAFPYNPRAPYSAPLEQMREPVVLPPLPAPSPAAPTVTSSAKE